MRIGTAEAGSTFLSQGLALKTLLERQGLQTNIDVVIALSASIENAEALARDALDFGFMASNWIGRAMRGEAPFTRDIPLRMVAPANAGPLFFITKADSSLRTVADLRGRRVCVGPATSGMAQHADTMFRALGLSASDLIIVNLDFVQGAEALKTGEIDAQLQCPIPNKVMSTLDASTDLRVLEWGEDLATVLSAQPLYRPTRLRPGQLRCVEKETAQPAVVNVIVTRANADSTMVRNVVRAILNGAHDLVEIEPLYEGLPNLFEPVRSEGAKALEFSGVPLHEGAVAAYREAGLLA